MANLAERITVDLEQCGGRPCIRGMRIRVTDVLDLLANGLTSEQVLNRSDTQPSTVSPSSSKPQASSAASIRGIAPIR